MPRFAEVIHREWIDAPVQTVSAQFADLDHHIRRNVHPKLRFQVLERQPRAARFVQEVSLLGIRQRDVFERQVFADGRIEDLSVEGFNRGGQLSFRFAPAVQGARSGTEVTITIRLPLPPVIGVLVRPLLEFQIRREVRAAAQEDKCDIERGGYRSVVREQAVVG
ncbi:MAG: SRPBCC family protein [Rubrivivax sp.]|nr:SRPBCC family protein [Rubrivivax sp.]